jgi:hypothetical protein
MSKSISELDESVKHRVFYGRPQHETDAPEDPDRGMFPTDDDEDVPSEVERYASFRHYCGDGPTTTPRVSTSVDAETA